MFNEDLTTFFNANEFADNATLAGVPVVGIFEKQHIVEGAGMGFAATRPAFTLPASAVPVNHAGKPLVLEDGTVYRVGAIDPDGSDRNVTVLLLELA